MAFDENSFDEIAFDKKSFDEVVWYGVDFFSGVSGFRGFFWIS
jgi:hypothetical protein